jgi:putative nucleotidyltransferase with HDIG domain
MADLNSNLAKVMPDGWLVGGTLRDQLLSRPTADYDVVVPENIEGVERAARERARAAGGFAFPLSEAFGAWRVVAHNRAWQVDINPAEGGTIESDLARRDLTVNAIARRLRGQATLIDPFGGVSDLERRLLRAVSPEAFRSDPLRVLRLARLAAELGFAVEADTAALAGQAADGLGRVAPERMFAELRRIICSPQPLVGLELMEELGATAAVLPELTALRGVEQSRYHHLDVLGHTRAVLAELISLEKDPEKVFGEQAERLRRVLDTPLANELTRGQALRLGALFHDIAKPQTRAQTPEGRVTFMHHDESGAAVATAILTRLRASERLIAYVAELTRHHLRLGFLVHRMPLDRREIFRYLDACAPVAVEVTVLSVADRLGTRGENSEKAIDRHLELARQILPAALDFSERPPRAPVRGDELGRALGVAPGPAIGRLLHELEEAAYAGEVSSSEEAIAYARRLMPKGEA